MAQNNTHGFTLVELAIALMVIGLLIGGVLKGQELIENARITSLIKQLKSYDAATMIFFNTYDALPGDIRKTNRIPNCTDGVCTMPGDGSTKIGDVRPGDMLPNRIEIFNFYPHLTKAGLIQSSATGLESETPSDSDMQELSYEKTSFGDSIQTFYDYGVTTNVATHIYYIHNWPGTLGGMPTKQIIALDEKLDDGKPVTGSVQVSGTGCPTVTVSTITEYDAQITRGNCAISVTAGF